MRLRFCSGMNCRSGVFFCAEMNKRRNRTQGGDLLQEAYMRRAIALAERGAGKVSPNPLVGAVIVRGDRIIGEGWHAVYGGLHAERSALLNLRERGEDPSGADMYVTLEPCCHFGKQPPCTDAIIEAGIARVYVGLGDPNPLVAGQGIRILRDRGIEVEMAGDAIRAECARQNEVFLHYIRTGLPFVVLKYAMTLDGKTACYTGASRWVTGEEARADVHRLRNRYSAIMVGIGTVLTDDPLLTCRMEGGRNPLRIVCDSRLRTPLSAKLVQTAAEAGTLIATTVRDPDRHAPYLEAGCRILVTEEKDGRVDMADLMTKLGASGEKVDSILAEGGSGVAWSLLRDRLVHKVLAYISPKLFGGAGSPSPVGGTGYPDPADAMVLTDRTVQVLGEDLLVAGYPQYGEDDIGKVWTNGAESGHDCG